MEESPNNTAGNIEAPVAKRAANEADTEFARKTHHAAYHDVIERQFGSFNKKMQDDFFAKSWKPGEFEILLSAGSEAGYCHIERLPDRIVIHELVLLPEFQEQGIGSRVLKEVIGEAQSKNIPVKLQVLKENPAQNLYRKLGFRDTGTTDTHIQMEYNRVQI